MQCFRCWRSIGSGWGNDLLGSPSQELIFATQTVYLWALYIILYVFDDSIMFLIILCDFTWFGPFQSIADRLVIKFAPEAVPNYWMLSQSSGPDVRKIENQDVCQQINFHYGFRGNSLGQSVLNDRGIISCFHKKCDFDMHFTCQHPIWTIWRVPGTQKSIIDWKTKTKTNSLLINLRRPRRWQIQV